VSVGDALAGGVSLWHGCIDMRRAVLVVLWTPALALAAVLFGELALRLTYAVAARRIEASPLLYERVYWATPPWVHWQSIVYDDPELGRWMRPDSQRTYINLFGPIGDLEEVGRLLTEMAPRRPAWAQPRSVWHLVTNSRGMRDEDYRERKDPGTFRVAVLGDSWTVGVNVERDSTIPDQLERRLGEAYPRGRFEVLNFGAIGAGVESGLRLLPHVLAAEPDVVVLAYAQNDEAEASREGSEGTEPQRVPSEGADTRASFAATVRSLELARLSRYWALPARLSAEATIRRSLTSPGGVPLNDPAPTCPNAEAERSRYAGALERLLAELRRRRVDPVLVYNNVPEFPTHCTGAALRALADRTGVPLLDSAALLARAGAELDDAFERARGLEPDPNADEIRAMEASAGGERAVTAVFRVDMTATDGRSRPGIMGSDPALGSFTPNLVPLFDDGSHGDQVAGDRVYSRAVSFAEPTEVTYAFTKGDRAGAWVGLENYRPRVFALRDDVRGGTTYLPIARFGRQTLRSDASHPDADGYAIIAQALLRTLQETTALRSYARAREPGSSR
jgi:lysophospholipase L1-like esterase